MSILSGDRFAHFTFLASCGSTGVLVAGLAGFWVQDGTMLGLYAIRCSQNKFEVDLQSRHVPSSLKIKKDQLYYVMHSNAFEICC